MLALRLSCPSGFTNASDEATVHDYLYSTHVVPRSVADAVLREASGVTAVPGWRRQLMWTGVRVFSWLYWGTAATSTKPAADAAVTPREPAVR